LAVRTSEVDRVFRETLCRVQLSPERPGLIPTLREIEPRTHGMQATPNRTCLFFGELSLVRLFVGHEL
jgi:hypothetical protein